MTPPIGNKNKGMSEVAGIGMASVIHHVAIHSADATTNIPLLSRPSVCKNNKVKIKSKGPMIRPVICSLLYGG